MSARFSKMRKRVTIETSTESTSSSGAVTDSWSAITRGNVWCHKHDAGGRETERVEQSYPELDSVFTIRHSTDVANVGPTGHRLNFGGTYFDILAVLPDNAADPRELKIVTKRKAV